MQQLVRTFQPIAPHRAAGAGKQDQHPDDALRIAAVLGLLDGFLHVRKFGDVVGLRTRVPTCAEAAHPRRSIEGVKGQFDRGVAGVAIIIPAVLDHIRLDLLQLNERIVLGGRVRGGRGSGRPRRQYWRTADFSARRNAAGSASGGDCFCAAAAAGVTSDRINGCHVSS